MINKRKQAGMLGLDAIMALLVLSVLISLGSVWIIKQMDSQDFRIAADKQRAVADAVSKYLKDNFSTVLASATATNPVQITVPMLRNTNFLPAGFTDTNGFGQTIVGLARKPNANQLEAIVLTTGGQAISELGIRTIAENLGGPGGFISSSNTNVIQGVRGGWQVALSNYAINPGAGHTASALFLMDGQLANDYLYRNAVPGRPELNSMNTDLSIGGHNINNAAAINAFGDVTTSADVNARNVTATNTVTAATANITGETYTGGWFRSR
ncbi:shufflon system plasmid conjugative transfer pilus tip adhesin PilV, partial [Pseudomonas putida]